MADAGPRLTVRSIAEIVRRPARERASVLRKQKYPKQVPQKFQTHYYSRVLTAIRAFYLEGNNPAVLRAARRSFESFTQESRRENNKRVIDHFEQMPGQFGRKLRVLSNTRYAARISTIEVKLSADLHAGDAEGSHYIYYNCRAGAREAGLALETLEIAHWVLEQNGVSIPLRALEYVDLFGANVYQVARRRPSLDTVLRENARLIEDIWPDL
jgi:hypothetical protein